MLRDEVLAGGGGGGGSSPCRTSIRVGFNGFSARAASVGAGDDVTEHMSATPASNDDTLIRGSLESDLTLD